MQSLLLKTIGILIIALLSACNFPRRDQAIPNVTIVPDTAPAGETKELAQDSTSSECAFMWANDPLPELSDELNQALRDVTFDAVGYAQAYGENCVTSDGAVVRFLAMETDFYITLQVEGLDDEQVLGEIIETVMEVLAQFPTEETPGPQPGYVGITFETPDESINLWVMRTEIESALENGLRGKELFDSLQTR